MSAAAARPALLQRTPAWLACGFALWALGYNLGAPVLTLWAGRLGATATEEGIVGATVYVGMAVTGLVAGPLSDRVGRRSVLIGAWGISAIGTLSLALAQDWVMLLPGAAMTLVGAGALPVLNSLLVE